MVELSPEEAVLGFRNAMRRLAGGVTILTSSHDGKPYGMTMTAVMSLTMEPPALVAAVNRSASIAEVLHEGKEFCVNLLQRRHTDFCQTFSSLPREERFATGEWKYTEKGTPYVADAGAVVVCTVGPVHDFGTHRLVIGLVEKAVLHPDIDPLVHLDGCYRAIEGRSA